MDVGLTPQQRIILRRARRNGLKGASRAQVMLPLWSIALASLAPILLLVHPIRYAPLLLLPPLGLLQRRRVERRIAEWALDLREI